MASGRASPSAGRGMEASSPLVGSTTSRPGGGSGAARSFRDGSVCWEGGGAGGGRDSAFVASVAALGPSLESGRSLRSIEPAGGPPEEVCSGVRRPVGPPGGDPPQGGRCGGAVVPGSACRGILEWSAVKMGKGAPRSGASSALEVLRDRDLDLGGLWRFSVIVTLIYEGSCRLLCIGSPSGPPCSSGRPCALSPWRPHRSQRGTGGRCVPGGWGAPGQGRNECV